MLWLNILYGLEMLDKQNRGLTGDFQTVIKCKMIIMIVVMMLNMYKQ